MSDIVEIRKHRAEAETEIATAISETLKTLRENTGLSALAVDVTVITHSTFGAIDLSFVSSVSIDLGRI